LVSVPASEWIAKFDARREALLGAIGLSFKTAEPPEFNDYPLETKVCSACGEPSGRKCRMDGTAYYCARMSCQAARVRRVRMLKSSETLAHHWRVPQNIGGILQGARDDY
jgi:hypothetical protein